MITRRSLLALLAGASGTAFAQGISSRGVKPQPRGKPSGRPFPSRLTDVAREAGLTHPIVYGGVDRKNYIIEVVGAGVAFFDYDNDGWLDVLVLSGTRLEGAPPGATNRLYRNNRDGTFTDVTEQAGLVRAGWASAVTVGDYDNDGFDDLFITYYGHNVLYHNNGDGTFTDVTGKAGLARDAVRYGAGCTWVDYDRDGHLDLFVATYLDTTLEQLPKPGENRDCRWKGVPVNCGPRGLPTGGVQLFHNNGDGTFTDVSQKSGVGAAAGAYPMTTIAADFDGDGWPDIYVACDSTLSWLFRNQHDGTFRQVGLERGVAVSEDGSEQGSMGVAVGDYLDVGRPSLFVTNFGEEYNALYRNEGDWRFVDVTARAGVGDPSWGVGAAVGDAELVSVESEDENVKVRRKGDLVEVLVDQKPRAGKDGKQDKGGEQVHVEIPVSLVDALLSGEGDEANIEAAIGELERAVETLSRVRDAYQLSPLPSPSASRKLYACQVLVGSTTAARGRDAAGARTTRGAWVTASTPTRRAT